MCAQNVHSQQTSNAHHWSMDASMMFNAKSNTYFLITEKHD